MRDLFIDKRIVPRLGAATAKHSKLMAPFVRVRSTLIGALPWLLLHRRDVMAGLIGTGAVTAIAVNALMLQPGAHPAPIFAIRAQPVIFRDTTGTVAQAPHPHPVPAEGPKLDLAHKPQSVPLPRARGQSAQGPQAMPPAQGAAPRRDAIADLIGSARPSEPNHQLTAIQRALNDFGYGPIKVSGALDHETRESIVRFERDRSLAVDGQNSPQLRRALSGATGRTLD